MRLSEAIRLGSMLGPQGHGHLTATRRRYLFFGPPVVEYCALGAAHAAAGVGFIARQVTADEESRPYRGKKRTLVAGETVHEAQQPAEWGGTMHREVLCPVCHAVDHPVYRLIPHLNDDHRWTREQIAEFVATIEDAIAAEPQAWRSQCSDVATIYVEDLVTID